MEKTVHDYRAAVAAINGAPFNHENKIDRAALFLIAVLNRGDVTTRAAHGLGLPMGEAKEFVRRAKDAGIFSNGKICCEWFDDEGGGAAFIMDSMVLAGLLKRTPIGA